MRVASVVGARPNFIKLAPVHKSIREHVDHTIIHTGQHYDYEMSEIFFKEFELPTPDYNLEVGSGNQGHQTAEMIKGLEEIFLKGKFDLVLVYGDTNSTLAGALSAVKLGIEIAHVESGLRSHDRRMPEEINRVLTDHISDYLFAPTPTAVNNLNKENVFGTIQYTGDVAVEIINEALGLVARSTILKELDIKPKSYILFTMHRAENTSSPESLAIILEIFESLRDTTIVFPIHPRTSKFLKENNLYYRLENCRNVKVIPPAGYLDFVNLMHNASKVITDSGGVQKESYILKIPCITIRQNTEWVETVQAGWNLVTGINSKEIIKAVKEWTPSSHHPIFGDGLATKIIKEIILSSK